jgi:hypothetical protein
MLSWRTCKSFAEVYAVIFSAIGHNKPTWVWILIRSTVLTAFGGSVRNISIGLDRVPDSNFIMYNIDEQHSKLLVGKAGHKGVNSLTVTVNSLITATFWKVRVTR